MPCNLSRIVEGMVQIVQELDKHRYQIGRKGRHARRKAKDIS